MDDPARFAICSVARRIHEANGMIAAAAVANTAMAFACMYASAIEIGTRSKRAFISAVG
jgi:hypothetical protein